MSSRRAVPRPKAICASPKQRSALSLEEIVDRYIHDYRPDAVEEIAYFANQPSLDQAVELAAMSITQRGKRHPHQRRIPRVVLEEARNVLRSLPLKQCRSFHELFCCLSDNLDPIPGIGELTVYDIATRMGAFLGLEPENVYLHAGTRAGARALGLRDGAFLEPAELPAQFARLKPREIEDCLCIYKSHFGRAAA